jgi:thioesterase domain-containing protein
MISTAMQRGDPVPPEARGRHALHQNGALMLDHRPRPPFPERVLLLRTNDPDAPPDRGWRAIVGEALEIVDVAGTHTDLCRELAGSDVGSAIGDALNHVPRPVA